MAMLRRVLLGLVVLLVLAALAQAFYWAPHMPERMASHFRLTDNQVDGWSSRRAFFVLALVLQAFMAATFVAVPLLVERLPDALINMPHKAHWLAPPRRAESLAFLSTGLLAVGCATQLFLLVIFQSIYRLNADIARGTEAPALSVVLPFPLLLGLYLSAVAFFLVIMVRRFRAPA